MAVDTKQYLEQLAQTAGLSDEEKAGILKVAANEKFAKALGDDILRQSDYSRSMDKLAQDAKKSTDYYNSLLNWEAQRKKDWEEAMAGTQQHQQTVQQVQPDLTAVEKKWKDMFDQQGNQMIGLLEVVGELASGHAVEFKEKLDTAALKKIAVEKNLSLKQAYDEMVGPRRGERTAEQRKTELENARLEGARDFASKHKIPVDTQIKESYHVLLDRDPKKQVGADDYQPNSGQLSPVATRQLRDNFVEAWNSTPAGGTSSR